MPPEWKQCFDLGNLPYENQFCHLHGYRQTRYLHNLLVENNYQLYILVYMEPSTGAYTELYQLTTLSGFIIASSLKSSDIIPKIESILAQERNGHILSGDREMASPCSREARRVRFSKL